LLMIHSMALPTRPLPPVTKIVQFSICIELLLMKNKQTINGIQGSIKQSEINQ
jgi:hypothetical protein